MVSWRVISKYKRAEAGLFSIPYLFVLCMNVLSLKIDKAVMEKKFQFHPRCKALSLTHLCFADDLMVFVEGSKRSIEGTLFVFWGVC